MFVYSGAVFDDDIHLTWTQRRELDLELWLMDHMSALAETRPGDLDDPDALRALGTRAQALADVVERLRALRGDRADVELAIAELRAELDALP
jgi:hypothetical protein